MPWLKANTRTRGLVGYANLRIKSFVSAFNRSVVKMYRFQMDTHAITATTTNNSRPETSVGIDGNMLAKVVMWSAAAVGHVAPPCGQSCVISMFAMEGPIICCEHAASHGTSICLQIPTKETMVIAVRANDTTSFLGHACIEKGYLFFGAWVNDQLNGRSFVVLMISNASSAVSTTCMIFMSSSLM